MLVGSLLGAADLTAGHRGAECLAPGRPHRSAGAPLIRNGGFEDPEISRPWRPYFHGGQRRIPGWRVVRRSVDLVGTDWPAGRGRQSLGVNGFRPGWITQLVPTEPDAAYRLTFLVWGDPNGPPPVSRLAVRWNLERVRVLTIDLRTQHTWRRVTVRVRSTTTATPLGFRGLSGGNAGPAIDAIRVRPVPTRSPAAVTLGLGTRR